MPNSPKLESYKSLLLDNRSHLRSTAHTFGNPHTLGLIGVFPQVKVGSATLPAGIKGRSLRTYMGISKPCSSCLASPYTEDCCMGAVQPGEPYHENTQAVGNPPLVQKLHKEQLTVVRMDG